MIFPQPYQVNIFAPGQQQIILVQQQTIMSEAWRAHYDREATMALYGNMPFYHEEPGKHSHVMRDLYHWADILGMTPRKPQ